MQDEWTKYLLSKSELHGMGTCNKSKQAGCRGGGSVIGGRVSRVPWEGQKDQSLVQSKQRQEQDAILVAAAEVASLNREVITVGVDVLCTRESETRGRGRGKSKRRDATLQACLKNGRLLKYLPTLRAEKFLCVIILGVLTRRFLRVYVVRFLLQL
jgi:hypothetical protein